ncbi:hypothetical protein KC343_g3378 [Hortaea werneckii]|uniref:Uncharacterized protein n=1 Tax=Hortaea werneckii TaxID=91943 RepID=A0A3M7DX63_HORWE|nr:hypothetical protein KC352_g16741 [Hortaea werneckii]KAI7567294.1 hypothetical protein KC317_g5084 [Hortaea werneckii]KAI7617695.1 hypothetical protein KC346_g5343 [Hortaea werneckii]KAI7632644.1 hypothetical protein KC343_g3378 [Hortaea werneckii]KAI7678643.1 hypothetical protein KC319_g3224 [Hortaea werneckii]
MELPVRTRKDSAASAKKGQQQQAPRTTFVVLPRELRDQIYGYLLSHEYTKMPPYHTRPTAARGHQSEEDDRDWSAAHTYRFHVNILAVNKQIRQEATEELLRRNTFVLISWKWDGLGALLHQFDLPIIADNQKAVAKFKMHALRLHLSFTTEKGQIKSLLMLHSDLEVFCRAVRYLGAVLDWPAHFVVKHSKPTGDWFGVYTNHHYPAFVMKIQLNDVDGESEAENIEKKAKLLAPLVDLRIAGQKLKLLRPHVGETQSEFAKIVDDLTKLAAPSLVWVKLAAWDLLDISLDRMAAANELCGKGEYDRALMHYLVIIFGVPSRHLLCNLPPHVAESDAAPPVMIGLRVLMDAIAAYGWLCLRRGKFALAGDAFRLGQVIFHMFNQFPNRDETLMPLGSEHASWVNEMPFWHFSALSSFFEHPFPLAHYLDLFETLRRQCPDVTYITHDLEVLVDLSKWTQNIALEDRQKLLWRFSVGAFPPKTFIFQIPEHIARPTKVSGWHDLEQYEDATASFKDSLKLGSHNYTCFPKQKE